MNIKKIVSVSFLALAMSLVISSCGDMEDGKIQSSNTASQGGVVSDIVSDVESIIPSMPTSNVSSEMQSNISTDNSIVASADTSSNNR